MSDLIEIPSNIPEIADVAKKSRKKPKKQETKVKNYWDSVHIRSVNKVLQEEKYKSELRQLREEIGMDVISDYIFGIENSKISEYLEKREDIDAKYEGKRMDSSIDDQGNFVYSKADLEVIEFMKQNSI
jgi:hypothetical protein